MRAYSERFLVVIRLNDRSNLEITTTAEHALAILSGETIFPPEDTEVFDRDGNLHGVPLLISRCQ